MSLNNLYSEWDGRPCTSDCRIIKLPYFIRWWRIHIIHKLKFKLDRKSLETIYLVFIRPLLEYGDVIWDNCTKYEKNELDKIQNVAAWISTGTTKLLSLDNLYKEVWWQTLHKRRPDHKIALFYKMFNQLPPVYLSSLIRYFSLQS